MFGSAGGGGKRLGTNKHNLQQQQQQSQLQPLQHPSHTQTHQLLQNHIPQQQQIQNNTLIHHSNQKSQQNSSHFHPLSQPQQTIIVQQKSSPPPNQQSQYQQPKIPIGFFSYQLGNVHGNSAAAKHQQPPLQTTVGSVSQMSPPPTNFVCNSNDSISGNRHTGIISSHYISHTTNMTPGYHLQQNGHLMVTTPYNNVPTATAGNGASQLTTTSAGAALYPPTQQPQTPPAHTQQQLLMNPQHALQYFQNNSAPIHSLQHHHPPQQMQNMLAMVAPAHHQYILQPNFFPLTHAATLPPQALANASAQYQTAAAPRLATGTANGAPLNTQMQNVSQRNAVVPGPTAYGHAQYCTPPLDLASAGMVETTASFTRTSYYRSQPPKHVIPIINPYTNKQVKPNSKKETKVDKQSIVMELTETCSEQINDLEAQKEDDKTLEKITYEDVSVQTEEENSLTASIDSNCSEIITQSHPATDMDKHDDEKVQVEMTISVNDTDNNRHLDEVDLCSEHLSYQQVEDINSDVLNEIKELKADEYHCEDLKNIVDVNNANTAASSNPQSTSGTESLKICIYGDPYDTDADANEHELDDEDLDIEHSKDIDIEKSTSCMDDNDNSCTPSKLNDDELNQNATNESKAPFLPKQTRNSSKKGGKRCKKNKKKSKQQNLKTSETNNQLNKNSSAKTNNNTLKDVTDKIKAPATTAVNAIKTQQPNEQPKISAASALENYKIKVGLSKSPEAKADAKKPVANDIRPDALSVVTADTQKRFIRYTMDELKALANSKESNKIPTVRCQKGGCISQLFVARQQQQHFYHSQSFTNSNNKNMSHTTQHHINASGNKSSLIRINLSLKEEIHLSRSNNAWQPKVLQRKSNQKQDSLTGNTEEELNKVRGILNKLTLDNFQILVKSMKDIHLNSQESIEKVMLLIFEKTVSEPNFAPIYAKFCDVLFQEVKPESKKLFNTLLKQRLQTEFENNVNNPNAKSSTLQHIIDKLNESNDPKEKLELKNEYDVEEYKFRRRAWGTVRFIGEMYKLNCLTSGRALQCVESLLENCNEEKLEYLCKLLTTVGPQLDGNGSNARLNIIFRKIQNIVRDAKTVAVGKQKIKISSRVRFMLEDIIDLRLRNWDLRSNSTTTNSLPSAAAMRTVAQQQHKSNFSSSNTNLNNFDRANNQRMGGFGNNNRQGRNNNNVHINMKEKNIDLKKLNFSRGVIDELGNMSIYRWRNDSQQSGRISPLKANSYQNLNQMQNKNQSSYDENKSQSAQKTDIRTILELYSAKDNQKLLNHLIEEYLDRLPSRSKLWQEEIFKTWQKTEQNQQICVIYYILMEYLYQIEVKEPERNACANIFIYLLRYGALNKKTFARAYEQFVVDFPDLLTDVPNGWSYIFEFIGPILHEDLLKFNDIWFNTWRNDRAFTERFVKALVFYFTTKYGANYMRELWHKEFKLNNGHIFITDRQQWQQFIAANKFQFIYDRNVKHELNTNSTANTNSYSTELQVQRLEVLLNSDKNSNLALDYINTNVNINSTFLKYLTRFLCCDYAITMQATTAKLVPNKNNSTCSSSSVANSATKFTAQLNVDLFRKRCLPLLRLCLDANEDYEIICLNTIVLSMQQDYDQYSANNFICNIFELLYDSELIPKESFEKWYRLWRQQQEQQQFKDTTEIEAFMQKVL